MTLQATQTEREGRSPFQSTRVSPRTALRDVAILLTVILVTRLPMLGLAEPDSALFATGARQWMRGGFENLSIYSAKVCAAYYASVVALTRFLHLTEANCVLLMSILSLLAGLCIIGFGYFLGRRFVGSQASLAGMLLFALSPGLWWTTVEPHPQTVSIAFGLIAIWCWSSYLDHGKRWLGFTSILCMALAIAVKNDAVLMIPALFAVTVFQAANWKNLGLSVIAAGSGTALSLLIARLTLGSSGQAVAGGQAALTTFARIPKPMDIVRDGAPIVFGIGLITALVLAVGLFRALTADSTGKRWWVFLALWCLPGYVFWLCIAGNNIRHVLIFGLPLFWLGAKYVRLPYLIGSIVVSFLIPPNSNTFMYPSPNVPGSYALLLQKKEDVTRMADKLMREPSCHIGSYTNDYIVNALLDRGGTIEAQVSSTDVSTHVMKTSNGVPITFNRINTGQKVIALSSCSSLEYDNAGRKVRFFGSEWHIPIF